MQHVARPIGSEGFIPGYGLVGNVGPVSAPRAVRGRRGVANSMSWQSQRAEHSAPDSHRVLRQVRAEGRSACFRD